MRISKRKSIREQAIFLATENVAAEPDITTIYWFPDEKEVRLVEVEDVIPPAEKSVDPFYFDPSPADNMPAPSGIAIIRSDEVNRLNLPERWGAWTTAEKWDIDNGRVIHDMA